MCNHSRNLTKGHRLSIKFAMLILGTLVCGCTDYFREYLLSSRPKYNERLEKSRAHTPYFGTGMVMVVSGVVSGIVDYATARFAPDPPPPLLAKFLVVRSNTVVGKVFLRSDPHDPVVLEILQGTPRPGDLIIGIQNESKYEGQQKVTSP